MEAEQPASDNVRIVEEIVEVDGKKMKKIKKYERKLVKEYISKGILARQKVAPFGVDKSKEGSRLDKNPVFFEVHGKGKQIKVKVDTMQKMNMAVQDIDRAIEDERVRIRELEDEQTEIEFSQNFRAERGVDDNAVVRVSNIPDMMTNFEVRELFQNYGRIVMMTMPKPTPISEEQKRNQKRAEKRMKRQEKKMRSITGKKELKKEEKEETKKDVAKEAEAERTHRGFAYVYFAEPESAEAAIKELNDQAYYSQIISVKKARPRQRR